MRCPEVRDTMRQFIDGHVDSQTRKEVGLHLAECAECSRLIEGDKFWDDAILALLDREAPADLRAQILAETKGTSAASRSADRPEDSGLSRRTQFKVVRWAATRKSSPRSWLEAAAVAACALLFVHFSPQIFPSHSDKSFKELGPVTVLTEGDILSPETPLSSDSLSLSGRLF